MIEERQRYLIEYGKQWADKPVGQPHLELRLVLTCFRTERFSILVDG